LSALIPKILSFSKANDILTQYYGFCKARGASFSAFFCFAGSSELFNDVKEKVITATFQNRRRIIRMAGAKLKRRVCGEVFQHEVKYPCVTGFDTLFKTLIGTNISY
jgi:hypothetical protein